MSKQSTKSGETPPQSESHYTVLARRYRPQQFSDLVGQEPIAKALINALESNRVAHAYLFTGARGVGKTSAARILAKALNCVKGPTATPCGQCESCQAVAIGEDVDVLEIDGASNNKVEEVRELRQNVQYCPQRSRHKIYIIDEVHMLSTSAFNALLKTLEEPPSHVKFIFATTEVQKIPVTILSRCQRFDFAGIGSKRIAERLRRIIKEEEAEADDEALELIARRAAGSMRDAQSLLDQLLAFGGERLTAEQVHHLLGTANEERVAALAKAILDKDLSGALAQLGQAAEESVQLGELLDQLLEYWRDLMLLNSAGPKIEGLTFSQRFRETLQQQAQALSLDTLLAGMDILAATKYRLRGTSHGQVLMEMAVIRLCRLENLASLSEIAQLLRSGDGVVRREAVKPAASPATPAVKKNFQVANDKPSAVANEAIVAERGATAERLSSSISPSSKSLTAESVIALSEASLGSVWQQALAAVGPMFRAELEKGQLAISAPNCLVLSFSSGYNKAKDLCQEPGRSERLEEALRKITGQSVQVRYELMGGEAHASQPARVAEPPVPRSQQMKAVVSQEPLVRRAIQELAAQILHADEGFGTAIAERGGTPEREDTTEDV